MSQQVHSGALQMLCLGLNHHTAPLQVREKFAVAKRHLEQSNQDIVDLPAVRECVLLSTCNRTEIYFWSPSPELARADIMRYFLGTLASGDAVEQISACFYCYEGGQALRHLACVAAGMDSMVIGETEIFGQLKDAYRVAQAAGSTATCSNRTFQRVFSIGKKVRTETRITSGPTSVGAAAVQLAGDSLNGLAGANVLIVGAGDIARSTAQSLASRGAEGIFVANRSYERAVELAEKVGGRVIRFSEWVPYLEQIDIVIVSTASPVYVVSPPVLRQAQAARNHRPLFLIDLSVPRNVDPACALLPDVYLYDIDTLQEIAEKSHHVRRAELERAGQIIESWVLENETDLLIPHVTEVEKLQKK
ncbi:MAG: glutamyl-tRNA reductase [Akkermansiaceae bacterium]|nr:glutamyl-tRNA reductase [Akkermansiaceae bacterium]